MLVVALPLLFISRGLVSQAATLYSFLSQQMSGPWSGHLAWANDAAQRLADHTGIPSQQIKSTITGRAQELGAWLVGIAGWAARGFMQQVGTVILTFLIMFFFCVTAITTFTSSDAFIAEVKRVDDFTIARS